MRSNSRRFDDAASMLALRPLAVLAMLGLAAECAAADEALFTSRQVTPKNEYTSGIEGPAVDKAGVLYVVNFKAKGTIGQLKPGKSKSTLFATLPAGSIGNGIRFDRQDRMYITDFKRHNILVILPGQTEAHVYFHSSEFHQPNDLAIASDGTLFASDPSFVQKTGRIWRIARGADGKVAGKIFANDRDMGVTNGLDLSPDEKLLYVSESNSREVWSYAIDGDRLTMPHLIKRFDEGELDGLRVDVDGRIFVTRPGQGKVSVLTPDGEVVREIVLAGKTPTNLTFGGSDARTVFVTQGDGRFIESFRTDRPGREFCQGNPDSACRPAH
jgi:signal peptidase